MKSKTLSSTGENTQTSVIELKQNSSELRGQACAFGGLAFLFLFIAIGTGVIRNQWDGFLMAAFVVGLGASIEVISKWHERKCSTVYRLFANRLEVNELKIPHEDIASITWPEKSVNKKVNATIQVRLSDEGDALESDRQPLQPLEAQPLLDREITLNHLATEDRLLMLHYLQQIETEQHKWDKFSCRYLENWVDQGSSKLLPEWIDEVLQRHPFWASFVGAPYLLAIFLAMVSPYVYWTMGVSIAVSALVNIRLMHGAWFPPIGETAIGIAAVLIILGIVSACFPNAKRRRNTDESELVTGYISLAILALAIIFSPLVTQLLLAAGFKNLAIITIQFSQFLPCIPFVVQRCRKAREKKDNFDQHVERANRRWETHLESFYDDPKPETRTVSKNIRTKTIAKAA